MMDCIDELLAVLEEDNEAGCRCACCGKHVPAQDEVVLCPTCKTGEGL